MYAAYCHTRNIIAALQGAAHSDAIGNVPLAVAARVGAAEEVKQVLFEAHRGAVAEKGLWDVVLWGEGVVRSVLEVRPEVSRGRVREVRVRELRARIIGLRNIGRIRDIGLVLVLGLRHLGLGARFRGKLAHCQYGPRVCRITQKGAHRFGL